MRKLVELATGEVLEVEDYCIMQGGVLGVILPCPTHGMTPEHGMECGCRKPSRVYNPELWHKGTSE